MQSAASTDGLLPLEGFLNFPAEVGGYQKREIDGSITDVNHIQRPPYQKCLTAEYEKVELAKLELTTKTILENLQIITDPQACLPRYTTAFIQCHNRFAQQFVNLPPYKGMAFTSPHLTIAYCTYMGVPDEATENLSKAGMTVRNKPLDVYGDTLFNTCQPGDGWTTRHDKVKLATAALAVDAKVTVRVEPRGMYKPFIPSGYETIPGFDLGGIRPDLLISGSEICEVKGIGCVKTYYNKNNASRVTGPVNTRAKSINQEYIRKARKLDQKHYPPETYVNGAGPFETAVKMFGKVTPLVFGAYGEVNTEFEELISQFARRSACNKWRTMGARSEKEANGVIKSQYIKQIAICAIRAQAEYKMNRIIDCAADYTFNYDRHQFYNIQAELRNRRPWTDAYYERYCDRGPGEQRNHRQGTEAF